MQIIILWLYESNNLSRLCFFTCHKMYMWCVRHFDSRQQIINYSDHQTAPRHLCLDRTILVPYTPSIYIYLLYSTMCDRFIQFLFSWCAVRAAVLFNARLVPIYLYTHLYVVQLKTNHNYTVRSHTSYLLYGHTCCAR